MQAAIGWSNVLFGRGDDGYPFWLLTVRVNILLFVLCAAGVVAANVSRLRLRKVLEAKVDIGIALALTAVAALLRFFVVEHNLCDLGGISYSRILLGYKGHFGAAQLYSLVYARTARDLEHAILLNRIAATLTVPLIYALCRRLAPARRAFALCATVLFSLHPLHLLFSATDALPISSSLLAAAAYWLLVSSDGEIIAMLGAAAGLTLLTQVRYENLLLLAPALIYLLARRRALSFRRLWPAAILFAFFMSIYTIAAIGAGSSYQNPVQLDDLRTTMREVFDNSIFAIWPVIIGTAATLIGWRSRLRLLVLLPLMALPPLMALANLPAHNLARAYINELLLLSLVAGYGLALLWDSRWWIARGIALGTLLWVAILPGLFWPTLHERHLETVEHDFFRAALAALPSDIDRIVVPDDEVLIRETHSTIESLNKYKMIASSVGANQIELMGTTRFLEHRADIDCARGNCLFFRGVPCMGIRYYWFAEAGCAQLMAMRSDPPVREETVEAGSFLDCSIYGGEARRRLCEPARTTQRFALYRITN